MIGLRSNGEAQVNHDPHVPLPAGAELLLIGMQEVARRFQKTYGPLTPDCTSWRVLSG